LHNLLLPVNSNRTLSFNPNFNSGIPVSNEFIFTVPRISEDKTVPFAETLN